MPVQDSKFSVATLRSTFPGPHCLVPTSDGKTLFMRVWEPPAGTAVGNMAILFLHGITAHSGAYNNILATPLAKGGFPVYGLDLRGHGLSDGVRGDIPSKKRLVRDICEAIACVKQKHPQVILLGHSVGVVAVNRALGHCPELCDAVVFLSFARRFRSGMHKSLTTWSKVKIACSALFRPSHPVINYSHPGIAGVADPMYTFTYTLRFMRAINPRGKYLPSLFSIPVYVGAGEYDELFGVDDVRKFYEELPASRKDFYVFPGAKHAAFPEGCLNHLLDWMKAQVVMGTPGERPR